MRRSTLLAVLAAILPASGCCSLSRFFCGPDRTPWIWPDFETPEVAVKTLLEALRRDEPEVVYRCLSNDYRQRLGLDKGTMQLAWAKIREANPGLHVAGYAQVPTATRHGPDRAQLQLDIEGHPLIVQLVRQSLWATRYRRENGTTGEPGAAIDSFAGFIRLEPDEGEDRSRLSIAPLVLRHDGLEEVPLEALEYVGFVREWKIADLRMPQP